MTAASLTFRCLMLAVLALTGCARRTQNTASPPGAYVVFFSATRSADHTGILKASVPVNLNDEAKVKTVSGQPAENQPAMPEFVVRLKRMKPPGVYELVTRASVREAIRNKKGKFKVKKRYIGALVPTRLGETQSVSTDSDPIHLEARLEHR